MNTPSASTAERFAWKFGIVGGQFNAQSTSRRNSPHIGNSGLPLEVRHTYFWLGKGGGRPAISGDLEAPACYSMGIVLSVSGDTRQ